MGSRISWQKVLGSFFPSGLVADLLNLPVAGSKYLEKESSQTSISAQFSYGAVACSACSGQRKNVLHKIHLPTFPHHAQAFRAHRNTFNSCYQLTIPSPFMFMFPSVKISWETALLPACARGHRDRAVNRHNHILPLYPSSTASAAARTNLELKSVATIPHLSPHSFFIMSSTFLARSDGFIWESPLAANFATYISANCFRVKAQPCRPEPKPTVPSTGSI